MHACTLLWPLVHWKIPAAVEITRRARHDAGLCSTGGLKQVITQGVHREGAAQAAGTRRSHLSDVGDITGPAKVFDAVARPFAPRSILLARSRPEETAAILFTSGSEGAPKGVELTHANILAKIRQMLAVCDSMGPLFQRPADSSTCFGLTIGTLHVARARLRRGALTRRRLHYRVTRRRSNHLRLHIMLARTRF